MKIYFAAIAGIMFCVAVRAQNLSVIDNVTLEPVVGASIYSKTPQPNGRLWGTTTNENGEADITPIAGEDSFYVRHPNYGTQGFLMKDVARMNYKLRLSQREVMLDEVVFSANKTEEEKSDVPYTVEVIDSKDVIFSNPQTTGDALQNTGQVFVQRSQMGGSSPVLRGFEASRVLMVVDGVRMNNAIYRAGHLQDCITIDQNMLERTEVIFGPSSTMYGSDALGGTMHFFSKKPVFSSTEKLRVKVNGLYRFSTANDEATMHLDFGFGKKKWATLTSLTSSTFGDLRMGANANPAYANYDWCREYIERVDDSDRVVTNTDPLMQKFTGYNQVDFTQKILFSCGERCLSLFNFQYSTTTTGVPRYDRLQQRNPDGTLRYAEWHYDPQNRMLASYAMSLFGDSTIYDKANIILAFQKIDQGRITRRRDSNIRNKQLEDVMVFSLNADMTKLAGKHELRYGAEVTHNIVNSEASDTDITSGAISDAVTRYPDGGSTMSTGAIYFSHSLEIGKHWVLSDGIRFTVTNLHAEWDDTTFYPFPVKQTTQTNFAPSGNLGIVFRPNEKFSTRLMLATGFRSPNVDDISKVFESVPGRLIIPNPDLNPEVVLGVEWGMDFMPAPDARISITGFYSRLENAIVVREFQLNGQDSVFYDGQMSRVYASQNADRAFITGLSAMLSADFNAHFSFRSTVSATYGRYYDTSLDSLIPMDHIPPVFGQTGLVYRWKGIEAEIFTRYNGWKHIADYSPSGEDNPSQAAKDINGNILGTPAWATINFRATMQLNQRAGISLACENILDQNYRNFASGVSAPGRNFIVALRFRY